MAFIPVNNTAQFNLKYLWDNQRCINTLYFEKDAPWSAAELLVGCNDLIVWWRDELADWVSSAVLLEEVEGIDLTSESGYFNASTTLLPSTGSQTVSPSLPNNVSGVVTFQTGLRGRSYRGRNFVLGLYESAVAGNTIVASVVDGIEADYALLNTAMTVPLAVHSVVSRFSQGQPRVAGIATPVTAYRMDSTIDSMRRRLPGRGA